MYGVDNNSSESRRMVMTQDASRYMDAQQQDRYDKEAEKGSGQQKRMTTKNEKQSRGRRLYE